MIPSNSLAAVYAIATDCAKRLVLGPDVAIDIEAIDETNTRIDVLALLARFRSHGNFGLVGLVGVQSNQYPRALDIARPFRDAGIQVAIGGFHVSWSLWCVSTGRRGSTNSSLPTTTSRATSSGRRSSIA